MSKSNRNCVVPGCSNRKDLSCCKWRFPSSQEIGSRTITITLCEVSTLWFGQLWKPVPSLSIRHLLKDSERQCKENCKEWRIFYESCSLLQSCGQNIPLSRHSCGCPAHFKKFPAASVTTEKVMCPWFYFRSSSRILSKVCFFRGSVT